MNYILDIEQIDSEIDEVYSIVENESLPGLVDRMYWDLKLRKPDGKEVHSVRRVFQAVIGPWEFIKNGQYPNADSFKEYKEKYPEVCKDVLRIIKFAEYVLGYKAY